MDAAHSTPLDTIRSILAEAMGWDPTQDGRWLRHERALTCNCQHRAGERARQEKAFEDAKDQFHRRYAIAYGNALRNHASHDEAHTEALEDALDIVWILALIEARHV